ncbi:MAG: hypothetical protein D9N11_05540, partial [Ketobacter sp.]
FAAVTFHDQHHEYFNCNYATQFLFWDKLMGTLHKNYSETTAHNLRSAKCTADNGIKNPR